MIDHYTKPPMGKSGFEPESATPKVAIFVHLTTSPYAADEI